MDEDENNRRGKVHWLTLGASYSGALTNRTQNCEIRLATALATRLFGCYRASDANDPETFIAATAATLAHYPEAVAQTVCHPVHGLPAQSKWLPSIAEIREACERTIAPARAEERREQERAHTRQVLDQRSKAPVGSPGHARVVEKFAVLRASLDGPPGAKPLCTDVRLAKTPEQREQAERYQTGRLEALRASYAAEPITLSPELAKRLSP